MTDDDHTVIEGDITRIDPTTPEPPRVHLHQLVLVRTSNGKFEPFGRFMSSANFGPKIPKSAYARGVIVSVDHDTIEIQATDFSLDQPVTVTREELRKGVVEPQTTRNGTPQWGY